MNIASALVLGIDRLESSGVADPRREASSLLAFVLQKDAWFLIAHPELELSQGQVSSLENAVNRRARHEPFQYIVGRQEFWRLDFEVTPDVLIPRPETEILVEAAVTLLSDIENPRFFEVGIGSGCIAISILHSVESAMAVGTDVSLPALEVAARNAKKHRVETRLDLRHADVFAGANGYFDLIVSNPPYVPDAHVESLQAEVRDFEPRPALLGGLDGLAVIRQIVARSPGFLKSGGSLMMEIGFDQAERVSSLFDQRAWAEVELLPDLQGIPRIVNARSSN